ncbi:MAG: DUF3822 family protein [Flavobacteriia bacterium]|nr:DUF3822 family protein [Flavobacteriia bacterium]
MVTGSNRITTRAEFIDSALESTPAEESSLSIFHSGNGLSFCLYHKASGKILLLVDYEHDGSSDTGMELLQQFNETFGKYILSWETDTYTWVPKELFNEKDVPSIAQKMLGKTDVQWTIIDELEAVLIHSTIPPVLERMAESLPAVTALPRPASSALALHRFWKTKPGEHVNIHVRSGALDILAFSNGKLILQNTYETDSIEDQLYFLTYAYEQLKFSPEEVPLKVSGDIVEGDRLWKTYQKYIRNVGWLGSVSNLKPSASIPTAAINQYASLVHLAACE